MCIRDSLKLEQTRKACEVLLSVLVYSGKQQGLSNTDVFNKAVSELGEIDISLRPKSAISLDDLNASLDTLARLKPLEKPRLLKACALCITADRNITPEEVEIYRVISALLDCPIPPLVL